MNHWHHRMGYTEHCVACPQQTNPSPTAGRVRISGDKNRGRRRLCLNSHVKSISSQNKRRRDLILYLLPLVPPSLVPPPSLVAHLITTLNIFSFEGYYLCDVGPALRQHWYHNQDDNQLNQLEAISTVIPPPPRQYHCNWIKPTTGQQPWPWKCFHNAKDSVLCASSKKETLSQSYSEIRILNRLLWHIYIIRINFQLSLIMQKKVHAYRPVSLNKITWRLKGFGLNSYLI